MPPSCPLCMSLIVLKFSKSRTGRDVRFSCHHNSGHFTFPIFARPWHFSVFHSLQSITPHVYYEVIVFWFSFLTDLLSVQLTFN